LGRYCRSRIYGDPS